MSLFLCPMRVKPALAVDLGSTIRTSYRNRHRDQTKLGTWVQLTLWGFPLFIGESHWHPRGTQEVSIPENKSFLPQETKEEFPGKLALRYLLEDKCCLVQWWLGETGESSTPLRIGGLPSQKKLAGRPSWIFPHWKTVEKGWTQRGKGTCKRYFISLCFLPSYIYM